MRFKLLRRRLTISAPRVAVRSAMPWPLRWAAAAIVLGFCGAISLWAFEIGRNIAGLDTAAERELLRLRKEVVELREERERIQSELNTSGSRITTEKAAQERLTAQIRVLEAENRALRDDLGFFEKLIPTASAEAVAIRGLQAEVLAGSQLRWQVLVLQPVKNAPEFHGRLELSIAGTQDGRPWTMQLPGGAQPLSFRQYRRIEGMVDLPANAVVQNVSARVVEGNATRAMQSIPL
ncbi:DUF6776 family protein [Ramlibacter tataouinensis]|uniref:Uncharacterized protein n=1 Tax=Ramlibacter tataouinensis (strain ATCC BAA-407 / DSM 14655 / LMG 21543 / TTB310) TaxID=365046 RepID=F5XXI0_RAMTT|nr:DUF6776 family protein [Ramlibacter tataouinensis]AEG91783.1 Conserved hypothetical protein [Ramlibacter tataouinensis TTB310]